MNCRIYYIDKNPNKNELQNINEKLNNMKQFIVKDSVYFDLPFHKLNNIFIDSFECIHDWVT